MKATLSVGGIGQLTDRAWRFCGLCHPRTHHRDLTTLHPSPQPQPARSVIISELGSSKSHGKRFSSSVSSVCIENPRSSGRVIEQTMTSSTSPSFFSLPLELRQQIYDELFCDTTYFVTIERIRFTLQYKPADQKWTPNKLSLFLLASKRVQVEALDQFYREAHCTSYSRCWCTGCSGGGTRPCERYTCRILKFSRIRKIDYFPDPQPASGYNHSLTIKEKDAVDKRLCLYPTLLRYPGLANREADILAAVLLPGQEHSVRELKLSIELSVHAGNPPLMVEESTCSVDLSCFENLGFTLDRVVFRVACPSVSVHMQQEPPSRRLRVCAMIFPALQREVERVAKIMVGAGDEQSNDSDDSRGYIVRDYMQEMRDHSGLIKGAYEWHLEAKRVKKNRSRSRREVSHGGLQYCRTRKAGHPRNRYDYYGPAKIEDGRISWTCERSQKMIWLAMPIIDTYD